MRGALLTVAHRDPREQRFHHPMKLPSKHRSPAVIMAKKQLGSQTGSEMFLSGGGSHNFHFNFIGQSKSMTMSNFKEMGECKTPKHLKGEGCQEFK